MKKLLLVWKKYINRVSVLVTVFSVLITASFYNPASLASSGDKVTFNQIGIRVGGVDVYNGSASSVTSYSGAFSPSESHVVEYSAGLYTSYATYRFRVPFQVYVNRNLTRNYPCYLSGLLGINVHMSFSGGQNDVISYGDFFGSSFSDFQGNNISYAIVGTDPTDVVFNIMCNNLVLSPLSGAFVNGYLEFTASSSTISSASSASHGNPKVKVTITSSYNDGYTTLRYIEGYPDGSLNRIDSNISDLKDGYDSSSGNASQSKLDISMSGQEAKEDSLFTSASGNLSKFSLTDLSAMPKVVAGLAFVSSTMTSIFEALGGVNGAGIVLSVGCSILFVSFCIGAYKFYSGRKD